VNRKADFFTKRIDSNREWECSMSDCSAPGPGIESRCGQLCLS